MLTPNASTMKNILAILVPFFCALVFSRCSVSQNGGDDKKIDLSGTWRFREDPADDGMKSRWYLNALSGSVELPGSMASNNKGDEVSVSTKWTGSIFDSSYFIKPEYEQYRQPGNIKVPFWLQPVKYYVGPAWYQRDITIPENWSGAPVELFIERSHWQTTVWVNDQEIGTQNSLATAQVFTLPPLMPGKHRLTIRVDNRILDVNIGQNSHSISDHTQSNWNGMVGALYLKSKPLFAIEDVRISTDIVSRKVTLNFRISNAAARDMAGSVKLLVKDVTGKEKWEPITKNINVPATSDVYTMEYPMGDKAQLWDEFNPQLYDLNIGFSAEGKTVDNKEIRFGLREITAKSTYFMVNGKRTFMRGTLESAIFPKTGYPATDTATWGRICRTVKSFGLNHIRFHSWCPPEAAFVAADKAGIYLQVECGSWANWGTSLGDGAPIDQYIYDESERIVRDYGNHPSFCFLAYGNEPGGRNHKAYLASFVNHWKNKEKRILITSGGGWPAIDENQFHVISNPRIQQWEAGLKSIINSQPPRLDYDWRDSIAKFKVPVMSHEIGQWCVYPDFSEMAKYTGVLKAKNFEIFSASLKARGLLHLADSFLLASGKLQTLCYKADIEAALRTPGFAGFQLLDLHDFPGQGSALVGVLNPFWEEKGYVTAADYSKFCNTTVPLARFPKMVYLNNEQLSVPVELAHFGAAPITGVTPEWSVSAGKEILFQGKFAPLSANQGNGIMMGTVQHTLAGITTPQQLKLTVKLGQFENEWDFFVYPANSGEQTKEVHVTQRLDAKTREVLKAGGKVLLTFKKGTVAANKGGDIAVGFSSIFWNTAWTNGQAPHTLGILCDPAHPAFRLFPTAYHSNWQWWDAMSHSSAIMLDSVAKGVRPIVRIVDDWVTNRSLGLVFECKIGAGSLLVTGVDLLTDVGKRPEARQLLASLSNYMAGPDFKPSLTVTDAVIQGLFRSGGGR